MPCCAGTGRVPKWRPNSPCWLLIWGTFPCCRTTITYTGSSNFERPLVKDSPATTASWLCPYRAGKEGSDEKTTSQSTGRYSARLLHRAPAACLRDEPTYHPQLPRHPGTASAVSLRAQQAAGCRTQPKGSRPTGNPSVSFLS